MKVWLFGIGLLLFSGVYGNAALVVDTRSEVDWKKGLYIVEGQAMVQNPKQKESREKALLNASKSAASKMMALIEKTSVKGQNPVSILAKAPAFRSEIVTVVHTTKPASTRFVNVQTESVAVVVLKISVFGSNKPGTIILNAVSAAEASKPPSADNRGSGYTSLIVDTSGLNIKRSMCPRVLRPSGDVAYNGENAPIDRIEEFGVVAYVKSLDDANQVPRCGLRPLIVTATGAFGTRNWDVVVSDEDADRILEENKKSKFLDNLNVIMVID